MLIWWHYVTALFMIGRNIASEFFKLKSLFDAKQRQEIRNNPNFFTFLILNITAIAGIVCGIVLFFPNQQFGYYLFFVVSGMMIYSYFTYAGIVYSEKNWIMFGLCIFVILFTSVLVGFLSFYMVTGIIE